MILKNIFWDRKNLEIFDENFNWNSTWKIKKVGFQMKFSLKIPRYFRTQKIFFKITYLHDFFNGISKIRMQNEATMLYYPLASIRQRFRPQRLLPRAAQRPPSAQQVLYHKLLDLRSFETWEYQEMSRYTCSECAQSNGPPKDCSYEATDPIWKIFIKKQKTSAHNSTEPRNNCS